MKRILLILLTFMSVPCLAQLKAPEQTDTLFIKSVKYNFSEIRPENWPCSMIIKSTTSFTIAGETFYFDKVWEGMERKYSCKQVVFRMEDGSILFYYEGEDVRAVEYSGYEFICNGTKPESKPKYASEPNARVQGRDILGQLPSPANPGHANGVVVVDIWIDQYGTVQKAVAGGQGTTLTDAKVWTAARNAAIKAHFNSSADAPALQKGTITYEFKMK